ncbi:MAG: EamA family transporter [Flavobacteriaceae bacterium]|nr:EamA family transporter [Flavobacteriaceae bacterium]
MIYLILSVFFSSSLFVIFKLFDKYHVDNFQAIIVNYFVAFIVGYSLIDSSIEVTSAVRMPWFYGAVILGVLFISIFNVMAITSQRGGLSVASVAAKMSVIIPIIFGILVYNESFGIYKLIGVVLALMAVYLTAYKKGAMNLNSTLLIFVLILFVGSGVLDTLVKYIETTFVTKNELEFYTAIIFLVAGFTGVLMFIYQLIFKKIKINIRSVIGGIVLGIPNYFSIFYLLKALQHPALESSTVFTINNVLIVMLTSLLGIVLFKEYLSVRNKVGILLSIVAILMFYL